MTLFHSLFLRLYGARPATDASPANDAFATALERLDRARPASARPTGLFRNSPKRQAA